MIYHLYVLIDPDTDEVRYVGQTTREDPHDRFYQHCHPKAKPVTEKEFWINGLMAQGKKPKFALLETTSDWKAELRWIKHYQAQGAPLTNSASHPDRTLVRATKEAKSAAIEFAKQESIRSGRAISVAEVVTAAIEMFLAINALEIQGNEASQN